MFRSRDRIFCEQNCKPGSVFDSHLSRHAVANALKPPRERPGQPICPHTGVAPDRVYSDGQFPAVGCALTAPFHPYLIVASFRTFTSPHCSKAHLFGCFSSPTKTAFLQGPRFLRRGTGRYISVALFLKSPSAGVTRYPCPVEPGLSSWTAFRPAHAAVCFPRCFYYTGKREDCQRTRAVS